MKKEKREKRKLINSLGENRQSNTVFLEDFNMLDGYFWISLCDTLGNHIGTSFYKLEKGNNNVTDKEYNEALHHIRAYLKRANNLCHNGDNINTNGKSAGRFIDGYENIEEQKEKYGKITTISVIAAIIFAVVTSISTIQIIPFILTTLSLMSAVGSYIHIDNLDKKQNTVIDLIHMNGAGINARLHDKRFSSLKITKVNLEDTPFEGLKELAAKSKKETSESEKTAVTLKGIAVKTQKIEEVIDKLSKVKNKDLCIAQLKEILQYLNQYKNSFFQQAATDMLAEKEYEKLKRQNQELQQTLTNAGAKRLIRN